jgi:hypothetical protein
MMYITQRVHEFFEQVQRKSKFKYREPEAQVQLYFFAHSYTPNTPSYTFAHGGTLKYSA